MAQAADGRDQPLGIGIGVAPDIQAKPDAVFRGGIVDARRARLARAVGTLTDAALLSDKSDVFLLAMSVAAWIGPNADRTTSAFATDPEPPSLFYGCEPDGLIIVSEPLDMIADHWQRVPAGHLLTVEGPCTVALSKFEVA